MVNDLIKAAKQAVEENVRHSDDSLRELLWKWFPEASDEEIDEAVRYAL